MTTKPNTNLTRRASFKLATAVSALAAGLGATLDSAEALAAPGEPLKLAKGKLGSLHIKLHKIEKTAKGEKLVLVESVELASVAHKLEEPGMYTIKLDGVANKTEVTTVFEQRLEVVKG